MNKNVNNQLKHLANQQNNQIDSTSSTSQMPSYQEQYLQALSSLRERNDITGETFKSLNKHVAQKRSQQQLDERAAKMRKVQMATGSQLHLHQQQQKSQQKILPTTQRPVPDLLVPKDDRKMLVTNSGSSSSMQTPTSSKNSLVNNSKSSSHHNRQSPSVSNVSSTDKATTNVTVAVAQAKIQASTANEASKYTPLQTSSTPIWKPHCTPEVMASHNALAQNLTKKNSGTIVD